jgi:isoleucyl-tRNA synthetase
VNEHLSNWYVRLSRRRFWKGTYTKDKIEAYQTLYTVLEVVAQLSSPIAPFFSDRLFMDLKNVSGKHDVVSVHLTDFPIANEELIDKDLEERMELAQKISSMVLSLRKKNFLRVRQPLAKIMIPVFSDQSLRQIKSVEDLIISEVNVKAIEYLTDSSGVLVKKIKPNFKTLGPKFGKLMKQLAGAIQNIDQDGIKILEDNGNYSIKIHEDIFEISLEDVEISTEDIPGWSVAVDGAVTVALDITVTPELKEEGLAREFVNRIQNLRKDNGLEVTDRINILIEKNNKTENVIMNFISYICSETLADISLTEELDNKDAEEIELVEGIFIRLVINKQ